MAIKLHPHNLIYPYFVTEGKGRKETIRHFPGIYRFSVDRLIKDIAGLQTSGIDKVLLFGVPFRKDPRGAGAYSRDTVIAQAVRAVKKEFPGLTVMTDVCLCAYTSHGHCGVISAKAPKVKLDDQKTLQALSEVALRHAEAGADWVSPSAMAKKQVRVIRTALNRQGLGRVKILGYSAKFASNFYGPFRNAAHSAPRFGDRRAYQLDPGDERSALKEIQDDIREGADMVMVKPALGYLDIIRQAKDASSVPLAAYNVSGEYALIKYGARSGLWDEKKMVFEVISSIKRAGADYIISYHAKDIAQWLKKN